MGLTNENVGHKILAKIKIYVLTRAELLFKVCYEIPCTTRLPASDFDPQGILKNCNIKTLCKYDAANKLLYQKITFINDFNAISNRFVSF